MHTNLQNTPSAGKLTGADLARNRWERRVGFVPDGVDQQGRIEAAHAATEVGAHPQRRRADHAHIGCGAFTPAFLALALVAACAALVVIPWREIFQ